MCRYRLSTRRRGTGNTCLPRDRVGAIPRGMTNSHGSGMAGDDFDQKMNFLNRTRYSSSAASAAVGGVVCAVKQWWFAAAFMAVLAVGFFVWWRHEVRKGDATGGGGGGAAAGSKFFQEWPRWARAAFFVGVLALFVATAVIGRSV